MKVSVNNNKLYQSKNSKVSNSTQPNMVQVQHQQEGIKSRFKLKQLNELVQSKSKQTSRINQKANVKRFPHQINKNAIQKTQIYLRTQNQPSNDLFENLSKSKSRSGITIKSKQKITQILQSKDSGRQFTSSTKKQKLSLISKLESRKITPFQQSIELQQQQTNEFKNGQNKENLFLNSNFDKMTLINHLNLKQLKQENNQQLRIYNKRPLKTTREIIESKMEKQRQKIKIKLDKKNYCLKTQRIRV